jgi:hypothetical protein
VILTVTTLIRGRQSSSTVMDTRPFLISSNQHLDRDAVPMDQQAFVQAVGPRGSEELKGATLLLTTSLPVLRRYWH